MKGSSFRPMLSLFKNLAYSMICGLNVNFNTVFKHQMTKHARSKSFINQIYSSIKVSLTPDRYAHNYHNMQDIFVFYYHGGNYINRYLCRAEFSEFYSFVENGMQHHVTMPGNNSCMVTWIYKEISYFVCKWFIWRTTYVSNDIDVIRHTLFKSCETFSE